MELYRYLDTNIAALKQANSPVLPWLLEDGDAYLALAGKVGPNRHGVVDLPNGAGGTLFDALSPAACYGALDLGDTPHKNASILVGTNIGYGLLAILQSAPTTHPVLVMEPRREVLGACLALTDYSQVIASGQVTFLPPDEKLISHHLGQLSLQFTHGAVKMHSDFPSRQLGPEYARWTGITKRMLEGITVELNTLRRRQEDMVGNELHNFTRSFHDGTLRSLEGKGNGVTALMVGAGPSLNDVGPRLAAMETDALIVTSMQTLPALQAAGITPHLCMAIDYSGGMLKVFNKLDMDWAANIPLIYSTKVRPDVVERYPGPTLPLWTVGGLATFVLNKTEPVFDAGGNVNVALLRFLSWCGVKDFVLAGQDYAWSAERSHAAGHHAARPTRVFDPKRHIKEKDADGNTIYSTMSYLTSKRDMERDIARLGLNVANIYGGGLPIAGTRRVTVDEAATLLTDLPTTHGRISACIAAARGSLPRPVFERRFETWRTSLKAATKRLEKLYKKPTRNKSAILEQLQSLVYFLRQDPLYLPYLYNEVMDMAGMARFTQHPVPADMRRFKDITGRVLDKVALMDSILGAQASTSAA